MLRAIEHAVSLLSCYSSNMSIIHTYMTDNVLTGICLFMHKCSCGATALDCRLMYSVCLLFVLCIYWQAQLLKTCFIGKQQLWVLLTVLMQVECFQLPSTSLQIIHLSLLRYCITSGLLKNRDIFFLFLLLCLLLSSFNRCGGDGPGSRAAVQVIILLSLLDFMSFEEFINLWTLWQDIFHFFSP